ncbi:hypothetical protein LZQ00_18095 [Sphingobacterium sp. SRCM116780]|uniref:hypothetical protein n=1 Tax=Sphingobacterium sp. SRCM116780 TaxID=2907623 RepID=UPI001F4566E6|nr:hypothetical protein [Sphingobacterium sp. SRCM116780]UIR56159.1 hypothetical protein LZQ00_18095 [Sphingobacterium sp. SRCM116780]
MENNYQLSRIHNYISGLMSKEEMFQLEKEALEDPFLQDAIEGYRLQQGVDVKQLSLLQQRLNRRVEQTISTRHAQFYTWQRLAIASAAGVIFVVLIALIYFKNFTSKTNRTTEVELSSPENSVVIEPLLTGGDASPIGGWNAFEQYLQKNTLLKANGGEVIIDFTVDKNGKLIHINFAGNPQAELKQETLRLLEQGPKWQGGKGKLKINFPAENITMSSLETAIKPQHCFGIEEKK